MSGDMRQMQRDYLQNQVELEVFLDSIDAQILTVTLEASRAYNEHKSMLAALRFASQIQELRTLRESTLFSLDFIRKNREWLVKAEVERLRGQKD